MCVSSSGRDPAGFQAINQPVRDNNQSAPEEAEPLLSLLLIKIKPEFLLDLNWLHRSAHQEEGNPAWINQLLIPGPSLGHSLHGSEPDILSQVLTGSTLQGNCT